MLSRGPAVYQVNKSLLLGVMLVIGFVLLLAWLATSERERLVVTSWRHIQTPFDAQLRTLPTKGLILVQDNRGPRRELYAYGTTELKEFQQWSEANGTLVETTADSERRFTLGIDKGMKSSFYERGEKVLSVRLYENRMTCDVEYSASSQMWYLHAWLVPR